MFGALMELLDRPYIWPTLLFVLIFSSATRRWVHGEAFWVDSGFTATDIGLVSVNMGSDSLSRRSRRRLVRGSRGHFQALWVLGLCRPPRISAT